ncbi:hypothetical protein A4G19_11675 [Pasteurellaceae bacterium Macca]|nr:hypothetical protein [Pasteurellaceae bacterium Macca]
MKKILPLLAIASFSSVAMADNFTGFGVGLEVQKNKYTLKSGNDEVRLVGKRPTSLNLPLSYGFRFGSSNFIGNAELKPLLSGGKFFEGKDINGNKLTGKFKYLGNINYAQGYQLGNFLPYVKVGVISGKWKIGNETGKVRGAHYGLGTKYALTNNLELGLEFMRGHLKDKSDKTAKIRVNEFSTNLTYRF